MKSWSGLGVEQWEHTRKWDIASGSSEFVRGEGALLIPGGFTSLSVFVRRQSQSASTFELSLWTAPVYFKLLDDSIDGNNASQYLLPLTLEPANALSMTGTGAKVFGAKIKSDQPMGPILFYELKNTGGVSGNIVADIYVVPNHLGTLTLPRIGSLMDGASSASPGMPSLAMPGFRKG